MCSFCECRDPEMTQRKRSLFFELFNDKLIHTFIRLITGKNDSAPSWVHCVESGVEDIWPTVTKEQRWIALMGLTHVYLRCDGIAEKLAKVKNPDKSKAVKDLEEEGKRYVQFLMKENIDFKQKDMFEQAESKWIAKQ